MNSRALIYAAVTSIGIVVWVLYLYKRERLKEDHTLLWLAVLISITVISLRQDLLIKLNWYIGAGNPTSLVLAAFIGFLLIISIFFSVKISELTEQNKRLVQIIALLDDKIKIINKEEK